jgi:septal ring factor EnvC (AmiA/AmiB activator)
LIGAPLALNAQSAADLKAKREQLLAEIKENTGRLTNTRRNKAATIEQLAIIQEQIGKRQMLITTLQQEISFTDASIARSTDVAAALEGDIERLHLEYSQLLRAAYRARLQNSWLTFLLSSRSFNEAFRRWQYLRQYQRFRSRQARLIAATQISLQNRLKQLSKRRQEKEDLLRTEQNQQQAISKEKNAQDLLLGRLKKDESAILTKIAEQERAREELNEAIESSIASEMAKVRRIERANRSTTTSSTTASASPSITAGVAFSGLRGKLPWPVSGTIVKKFGRQPHPTVKGVEISNNGIDIQVTGATDVKTVAEGVVVSTHFVPGYRNMVLVRHGDYYTVYSNLETVSVSSGTQLSAGQVIGQITTQASDLHFEVWRQKERLNPEGWISK